MIFRILNIFCLMLFAIAAQAATGMEETMFQSGKIYTFLTVAFIVMVGVFFYLFRLDMRLNKMEQQLKDKTGE